MGTAAATDNLKNGFPTPGPQCPTGQRVMDHVFFLSNEEWKKARETTDYDFVVIGSGFCSYAFVNRILGQSPHSRILILERGTFFLPEHFQNLPLPYVGTLGGMSETFPWTLSNKTSNADTGHIRWQHGMVPFFGGRSTLWSAWCPRPTEKELDGWPDETKAVISKYLDSAEELLHVKPVNELDNDRDEQTLKIINQQRPVYGMLQQQIQTLLEMNAKSIDGIYRVQAAPLASGTEDLDGVDFQKFSIPGELLSTVIKQKNLYRQKKGAPLNIATQCIVENIIHQNGQATALKTSRGILPLGNAKLILAMGTLPPTTLIQNSFPDADNIGSRFSAHFITAIVARVPQKDLEPSDGFADLELGACYIGGIGKDYKQQYHIQLSALCDQNPDKNAATALRYMPDVVATASMAQLQSSKDHVVFVCAVLGELDHRNSHNWFTKNPQDEDTTTNSLLQIIENQNDSETWNAMDEATFKVLEEALSPKGSSCVEYWHGSPDEGHWSPKRPELNERRVDAVVHESSTLFIGKSADAPVDLDCRLRAADNIYVTGGGLWPQGGSWNPTLTMVALSQYLADHLLAQKS